ncbi:hypothetical protein MRX96_051477 [Rhipicephalus microplus]
MRPSYAHQAGASSVPEESVASPWSGDVWRPHLQPPPSIASCSSHRQFPLNWRSCVGLFAGHNRMALRSSMQDETSRAFTSTVQCLPKMPSRPLSVTTSESEGDQGKPKTSADASASSNG